MTKSEGVLYTFLMALCGGLVFILSVLLVMNNLPKENAYSSETIITEIRKEYVYESFLTRNDINNTIEEENYFFFLGFYSEITGNREIAQAILDTSLQKDVPVNLAFALAFVESSFDLNAINLSNRNGTTDRGLFQLNSATFRDGNIDWFDPFESAELGLDYLNIKKERYDSWESAVVMYNAGVESNMSNRSLIYLSRILARERDFDERFNTFRRNININRD